MRRAGVLGWMVVCAAVAGMGGVSAEGKLVAMPQMVPAGEVVGMVEGWVKEHPGDGAGYYVLGRVEGLAWAYGEKIPVVWFDRKQLPTFGDYSTIRVRREGMEDSVRQMGMMPQPENRGEATAADLGHLQASIEAYSKAVALDGNNALYEEALAWMLQRKGLAGMAGVAKAEEVKDLTAGEKAKFAAAIGKLGSTEFAEREVGSKALLEGMPRCAGMLKGVKTEDAEVTERVAGVIRGYWDLQALGHYRRAFALAVKKDLGNQGGFGGGPDGLICVDAAEQSLAILGEHMNEVKKGEVAEMKEAVEKLGESKRNGMIMFDF